MNGWLALVSMSLVMASMGGMHALRFWQDSHLGQSIDLLPIPDLIFYVGFHNARYLTLVHFLFSMAMGGLAWGFYKSRMWALRAELAVCRLALASRMLAFGAWYFDRRSYVSPEYELHLILYFLGTIPAILIAWYCGKKYRQNIEKTKPESPNTGNSFPVTATVLAACLACIYAIGVAQFSPDLNYWQQRSLFFKAAMLLFGYASVLIAAAVPTLRKYAYSIGFGLAILSPAALIFPGQSSDRLPPMILLFFAMLVAPSKAGVILIWLFVIGNLTLLIMSICRGIKGAPAAMAAAYMFATLPVADAHWEFEQAQMDRAQAMAKGAPATIYQIQSCLLRIKMATGNTNYPRSLRKAESALGGCLPPGVATGRVVGGYRYIYQPRQHTPVDGFSLIAEPAISVGKYRFSFFSDETAVIRQQDEYRLATAYDRSLASAAEFGGLAHMVNNYTIIQHQRTRDKYIYSGELHFPETAEELLKFGYIEFDRPREPDQEGWTHKQYRFTYRRLADARPESFELTARPLEYGVTGIRSYFVDNSMVIHATVENRAATPLDPEAYDCELSSLGRPCGNMRSDFHFVPERPSIDAKADNIPADWKPGVIASGTEPRVFWRVSDDHIPGFVAVSDNLTRLLTHVIWPVSGVAAFKPDGTPLWGYSRGTPFSTSTNLVANQDSVYAMIDDTLIRLNTEGQALWTYRVGPNHGIIRSSRGVLYAAGSSSMHAIGDDGRQVWRVAPPEPATHGIILAADERVLYAQGDHHLYSLDAQTGKVRWIAENECQEIYECKPQSMGGGSIVVKWAYHPSTSFDGQHISAGLTVIDSTGRAIGQWKHTSDFDDLVPLGTDVIVVFADQNLLALDLHGKLLWQKPGWWKLAGSSKKSGRFYACNADQLIILNGGGEILLNQPEQTVGDRICGAVTEGPGDLLWIQEYFKYGGSRTLWTVHAP